MSIRQQLTELLGNGVTPTAAANATGCTHAYVSQLLNEPGFNEEVAKRKVNSLQAASLRDGKWDNLEDKLLVKMEELLPYITRPMEVMAALRAVNSAQRRGASADDRQAANVTNVLILQLPQAVKQKFVVNQNQEVIEVAGRTLVTIDSQKLLSEITPITID